MPFRSRTTMSAASHVCLVVVVEARSAVRLGGMVRMSDDSVCVTAQNDTASRVGATSWPKRAPARNRAHVSFYKSKYVCTDESVRKQFVISPVANQSLSMCSMGDVLRS